MIRPLKDYEPGEFERLHAAGSRILTASNIPALFGKSRFVGQFALAQHLLGTVPLKDISDSPVVLRGKDLEPVTAAKVMKETGWKIDSVFGYAEHPVLGSSALASPDMLAWDPDRDLKDVGIGEGKVVAGPIFEDRWADGPPIDVELQHQFQFRCTGARWGFISALVVGDFRLDLILYRTFPNHEAIELIDEAAAAFLSLLADGKTPDPDTHETSLRALHSLYPNSDPGKILMMDDPSSAELFDRWLAVTEARKHHEKIEKDIKAHFRSKLKDEGLIQLDGGRRVRVKTINKKGFEVKPTSFKQLEPARIEMLIGGPVEIGAE